MYSASTPSWHEASQQQDEEAAAVAAYDLAKRKTSSQIISRRRSEEEGGAGEVYWEGMAVREIAAGVEEVWEMLGTFSAMKRWNAAVEVCELVEGREGEVGCVRYCAGGDRWVKEKLLEIEPAQRRFRYTILDSSYGFQGYEATLAVQPLMSYSSSTRGTVAHWNFRLEPVAHLGQEKALDFLTTIFDRMMRSLEHAIANIAASNAASSADPPSLSQAVAVAN